MGNSNIVMERFMEKLKNNEFVKDNQPNNGPQLSDDFVDERLQSYFELMESGLLSKIGEQASDQ